MKPEPPPPPPSLATQLIRGSSPAHTIRSSPSCELSGWQEKPSQPLWCADGSAARSAAGDSIRAGLSWAGVPRYDNRRVDKRKYKLSRATRWVCQLRGTAEDAERNTEIERPCKWRIKTHESAYLTTSAVENRFRVIYHFFCICYRSYSGQFICAYFCFCT